MATATSRVSRPRGPPPSSAAKKTFIFGSSTPRDLTYMNKVPQPMRVYNAKPAPPPPQAKDRQTLTHYMRKARSVTPAARFSNAVQDGIAGSHHYRTLNTSWAFGSATPREFSHLSTLPPPQRVYDVKIAQTLPKSQTASMIGIAKKVDHPPTTGHKKPTSDEEDDGIASEPDFVQDRHHEFVSQRKVKNKEKNELNELMKKVEQQEKNEPRKKFNPQQAITKDRRRSEVAEEMPIETTHKMIVPHAVCENRSEQAEVVTATAMNDSSEVRVAEAMDDEELEAQPLQIDHQLGARLERVQDV